MRIFFFIILVGFAQSLSAQSAKQLKEIEEQYAFNIVQTHINDVYIPENIEDALVQLDELSNEAGRSKFLEADEATAAKVLVKGLGRWMMVNWNFYEGSRLSHYLKEMGVTHPEDMAQFLIVSYHRYLREVPQEYDTRAAKYEDQRKDDQIKRNLKTKSSAAIDNH